MSEVQRSFSWKDRARSVRYALCGIYFLIRTQHNAWFHLAASCLVCTCGIYFDLSRFEWCWVSSAICAVWFSEAVNTAFEILADVVCPQQHSLIGRAKDVAAGAVLICAIGASAIGAFVFWPHLRQAVRSIL